MGSGPLSGSTLSLILSWDETPYIEHLKGVHMGLIILVLDNEIIHNPNSNLTSNTASSKMPY